MSDLYENYGEDEVRRPKSLKKDVFGDSIDVFERLYRKERERERESNTTHSHLSLDRSMESTCTQNVLPHSITDS